LCIALSPDLRSRCHRIGKSQSRAISTGVNKLWKAQFALKLLALEFLLARERSLYAPWIPARPFRLARPRCAPKI
jgi:hypothetical protein